MASEASWVRWAAWGLNLSHRWLPDKLARFEGLRPGALAPAFNMLRAPALPTRPPQQVPLSSHIVHSESVCRARAQRSVTLIR